jgi:ESS family glutamate:Na+ symporter
MVFSASNTELWSALIQFAIISCFLILANILRRKIRFIDRSLLPVAVIAGFILLFVKEFGILSINKTFMESLTYHCTAIGFIALGLRVPSSHDIKTGSTSAKSVGIKSGMLIVSTYLLQAIIGLGLTMLIAYLFMPDLFMASGILLPLGFGQGPGQAYNIGTTYQSLGFAGGSSYGLAIASMGFIWASIGGASYMVMLRKKGLKINARIRNTDAVTSELIESPDEVPLTEALDKFTIQIALIFIVYLAT